MLDVCMVYGDPLPTVSVAPLTVKLPPRVVRPVPVVIAALFTVFKLSAVGESMTILPVVLFPMVSDCLAVVASVPEAVKNAAPLVPAETDAVGVPLDTFKTANFAEELACPPIKKSTVELIG